MARTSEEIEASLQESIFENDPSIDTVAGPGPTIFIYPIASELETVEEELERTNLLYSLAFARTAGDLGVEAFADNYGLGRDLGDFAESTQYFYRFTRPQAGQEISIPRGLVVTTATGLAFRTDEQVIIYGDLADTYYNPASGYYEVSVKVKAVAVGEDYNVAAYTITTLGESLIGIDGTENRTAATGGTVREENESLVVRGQSRLLGSNSGSHGGILADVFNYDPLRVKDVSIVFPSDWPLIRRRNHRPFLDVYVIGEKSGEAEDTYTAVGGETEVYLSYLPVDSVSSVLVNNSSVSYTFVEDTEDPTEGSTSAKDRIQLAAPLIAGDIVVITYTYNSLLWSIQQDLFSTEEAEGVRTRLFKTDILTRRAVNVDITVDVSVRIASSYSDLTVQSQIETAIRSYVETDTFANILIASELRDLILGSVAGVASLTVRGFYRTVHGTLDIEVIQLQKNERASIDATSLNIDVGL